MTSSGFRILSGRVQEVVRRLGREPGRNRLSIVGEDRADMVSKYSTVLRHSNACMYYQIHALRNTHWDFLQTLDFSWKVPPQEIDTLVSS